MTRSSLRRNILAVMSGTAAAQLIALIFSPLITRIYGPEIYGIQGVFVSFVSILTPVVALRYPLAIIIAKDDGAADQLAKLSLLIAAPIACFIGLSLMIGRQYMLFWRPVEQLGSMIWFLPIALFFVAFQEVMQFRAARWNSFRLISVSAVITALLSNLTRFLVGLAAPIAAVLVIMATVMPALQATFLRIGLRKSHNLSRRNQEPLVTLFKRHRDFPLYRVPTDVLNAMSQAVPVLLLTSFYSAHAAGFYTLTLSVLLLPANLIGRAIGDVIYPRYAELDRQSKPLIPLLIKATIVLASLAPIIIGSAWFAPDAFAFIFGEEWRGAGYYARWMAIWTAIGFINIPVVRIAPVLGLQKRQLIAQVLILVARFSAVSLVAVTGGEAITAVAVFSVVGVVANIWLIVILALPAFRRDKELKGENDDRNPRE